MFFPDVVRERAQRRNVDALHGRPERSGVEFAQEKIEYAYETGECFAAPGGRREEDRLPI
jgi:hypothetical protein